MRKSQVSEEDRKHIVEGFEGGSTTLSDYCSSQEISVDQYYKWRREFFGSKYKRRSKSAGFIALTSSATPVVQDSSPLHLEIEIAGIVIRVKK